MYAIERFISVVLTHPKKVVTAFIVIAVISVCLIPFSKTNYNLVSYLPPEAQSTEAVRIMSEEFATDLPNTNVMVRNVTIPEALEVKAQLKGMHGVKSVMWLDDVSDTALPVSTIQPALLDMYYHPGDDGRGTALMMMTLEEGNEEEDIGAIRAYVDSLSDDSLGPGNAVSGTSSDSAQMQAATVEQVLLASAIVGPIIIFLLILSTMSWIEPLLFLAAIAISIFINMGTNVFLDDVSFITSSVSPILQLAVSLDYAIFLLHEFAAQRKKTPDITEAMGNAMRVSLSTIAASAVTTLFGFLALSFMQFQIGADLGFNLAKGIIFSFITVVTFLPALSVLLMPLIDRTQHRKFMPDFSNIGAHIAKIRIPVLIIVLILVVPAFLAQRNLEFIYGNNLPDLSLRNGVDTVAINEEFGEQNAIVVLVPRGDVAREALLSRDIEALPHVKSVMSYAQSVGTPIPTAFLSQDIVDQFYSEKWARIIAYVDTPFEGDLAFGLVEQIQGAVEQYYDTYYTAGQPANLYDMRNVVAVDNVRVSLIAFIAIFLVVLITFRSLGLPLVLLLTIESGIWINLAIPYFQGEAINFIGYLVLNTVALGATIDYGILLTTHYLAWRKRMPAKPAIHKALGEAVPSILVSALTLSGAGFALSLSSRIEAAATIGSLLARGALMSMVLVTCLLPALFVLCDKFLRVTTLKADFYQGDSDLGETANDDPNLIDAGIGDSDPIEEGWADPGQGDSGKADHEAET